MQFITMYKKMRYTLGSKRFYINEFTLKNYQKCASIRIITSYSFHLVKMKRNLLYTRNQSVPHCKHCPPRL